MLHFRTWHRHLCSDAGLPLLAAAVQSSWIQTFRSCGPDSSYTTVPHLVTAWHTEPLRSLGVIWKKLLSNSAHFMPSSVVPECRGRVAPDKRCSLLVHVNLARKHQPTRCGRTSGGGWDWRSKDNPLKRVQDRRSCHHNVY